MKPAMDTKLNGKETLYWNALYHTVGMGVVKLKTETIPNGSGFGVIKKAGARSSPDLAPVRQSGVPHLNAAIVGAELPSDARLQRSVNRILVWMKIFPKDAVKVNISNRWMQLSGQVDWQFQRDVTIAALGSLYGITGYTDDIVILHPDSK